MTNRIYIKNCQHSIKIDQTKQPYNAIEIYFTCPVCGRQTYHTLNADREKYFPCSECDSWFNVRYISLFQDQVVIDLDAIRSAKQIDIFKRQGVLFG